LTLAEQAFGGTLVVLCRTLRRTLHIAAISMQNYALGSLDDDCAIRLVAWFEWSTFGDSGVAHVFGSRLRIAWWIVPLATLLAILGWESGWWKEGAAVAPDPGASSIPIGPFARLLSEYEIVGGLPAYAETVQRTLFNPTRRAAPVVVADASERASFQKGQFAFVGTSVAGDRRIAFLREISGGKSRMVRQGEQINGITVAQVLPDTVRLERGSQSEELHLVRAGVTAAASPVPNALLMAVPAAPQAPSPGAYLKGAPVAAAAPDVATTLSEGEPPPNSD
jgi:hypothetical protein